MADENQKLYIEMQMDELKESLESEEDALQAINEARIAQLKATAAKNNREKNAELAKLYENAAEYEKELEGFEKELEIINANKLKDISNVLAQMLPDDERNYPQELKAVVVAGWTEFVEMDKAHPVEQLEIIKETDFEDIAEKLSATYPDYEGDFETNVKNILLKRWDNLIAIKKEHIEEEIEEIYIAGLKPSFVKRIYKEFHGIT
ncbi:MAG: hypothetical protein Q8S36_03915 [Sulfuricurvum sp.]|nr:hypothetical protein [Sulfuricurvum sp.]